MILFLFFRSLAFLDIFLPEEGFLPPAEGLFPEGLFPEGLPVLLLRAEEVFLDPPVLLPEELLLRGRSSS